MLQVSRDYGKVAVLLGDVFDHPFPSPLEQRAFLEVLLDFSDIKIYIISGNHDYASNEENSLELYTFLQNTSIFKHVQVYTRKHTEMINGVSVHWMPWPYEKPTLKKASLIFAHHEFAGATGDNGYALKDGAPIKDVGKHSYIIGHLHRYQTGKRYVYVGSPLQVTFGEPPEKNFLYFEANYVGKELVVKTRKIPIDLPYKLITINANKPEDFNSIKQEKNVFYSLIIKKGLIFDKSVLNHPSIVKYRGASEYTEKDEIDISEKTISFDPVSEVENYLATEYKYTEKKLKKARRILNELEDASRV